MMRIRSESRDTKAALIEVMKSSVPMIVLTSNAIAAALTDASSSPEAAALWLVRLVTRYQKPIGINADKLRLFISPPRWSCRGM